jgi:hypothetical protein
MESINRLKIGVIDTERGGCGGPIRTETVPSGFTNYLDLHAFSVGVSHNFLHNLHHI